MGSTFIPGVGWTVEPDVVDERKDLPRLTGAQIDAINARIAAGSKEFPTGTKVVRTDDQVVMTVEGVGTAARFVSLDADVANAVKKSELAAPTGAGGVGTTSGSTVEAVLKLQPLQLSDRGVSHLNSATVNTINANAALAEAAATGRAVVLPTNVPDGAWIDISSFLSVTFKGMVILGDVARSRFRQITFPLPVFKVTATDVSIDGLYVEGVAFSGAGTGDTHTYYCGVYVAPTAHRAQVRNISGKAVSTVVNVHPRSDDLQANPVEDVVVENVTTDGVVFGLVYSFTKNLRFRNIQGSYKLLNSVPTPPHLVYGSDGMGLNYNNSGGGCLSRNGEVSFAYQLKGIRGGVFDDLAAEDSAGLLHPMNCSDVQFYGLRSDRDTSASVTAGSVDLESTNTNVLIDGITVRMATNGKPFRMGAETSGSVVRNGAFESKHTIDSVADDSYDVEIRGADNTAENISTINTGTNRWQASIGIWGGTANKILSPKTAGNVNGVMIRAGDGHVLRYLLSDLQNFTRRAFASNRPLKLINADTQYNSQLLAYDRANVGAGSFAAATLVYSTSGNPWVKIFGTWETEAERIRNSVGASSLAYLAMPTANIHLRAGIKYAGNEGLAFRSIDRSNQLWLRLWGSSNTLAFIKVIAGVSTTIASVAFTPVVGRRYLIDGFIFGDAFEACIDGQKVLTATIPTDAMTLLGATTNHGLVGQGNAAGLFDNVEWRSLD